MSLGLLLTGDLFRYCSVLLNRKTRGIRGHCMFFSINGPKLNARSLLTPISVTTFNALSRGSLGFALRGSIFQSVQILRQHLRDKRLPYWSCHREQNAGYHIKEQKISIRN